MTPVHRSSGAVGSAVPCSSKVGCVIAPRSASYVRPELAFRGPVSLDSETIWSSAPRIQRTSGHGWPIATSSRTRQGFIRY